MTDENDPERGMTYVEKLDFREQAHRHELERLKVSEAEQTKRAKYKLREERQETYRVIGVGALVVVVILAVIAWIYFSTSGDPTPETDHDLQREIACVEKNGGAWVPGDLLVSGESICVFPGKPVPSE